jgi:hypothetical protein
LTREAASSIASGSPSSRRQIAATSAALAAVTAKPGRTRSACCTNKPRRAGRRHLLDGRIPWYLQRRYRQLVLAQDVQRPPRCS